MATAGRRKRQQTSLRSLTSDEWKKFRDTYESYRILWDESLKSYNDESAKECLYNLFALKMKDSVDNIKKRIKSVRTHYSQAKAAHLRGEKLEGKPKYWFEEYAFLYAFTGVRQFSAMTKTREQVLKESERQSTPMTSPLALPIPESLPTSPIPPPPEPKRFMYVHPVCTKVYYMEAEHPECVFSEERLGIIPQYHSKIRQAYELLQRSYALEGPTDGVQLRGEQKPTKLKKKAAWIRYPVDEMWDVQDTSTFSLFNEWYMPLSAMQQPTMHWERIPKERSSSDAYLQLKGQCISFSTEVISAPYDDVVQNRAPDTAILPIDTKFARINADDDAAQDPYKTVITSYHFTDETFLCRNIDVKYPEIPTNELFFTDVIHELAAGRMMISTSQYHVDLNVAELRFPVNLEVPEAFTVPLPRRGDDIEFKVAMIPTFRLVQRPHCQTDSYIVQQEQLRFLKAMSKKHDHRYWVKAAAQLVNKRKTLKERSARNKKEKLGTMTITVYRWGKSVYDLWVAGTSLDGLEE